MCQRGLTSAAGVIGPDRRILGRGRGLGWEGPKKVLKGSDRFSLISFFLSRFPASLFHLSLFLSIYIYIYLSLSLSLSPCLCLCFCLSLFVSDCFCLPFWVLRFCWGLWIARVGLLRLWRRGRFALRLIIPPRGSHVSD